MPFAQLPWLTSSDQFLRAIEAGSQRANQIAQLQLEARRGGGGGGGGGSPGEEALRQAQAQQVLAETAQAQQQEGDRRAAFGEQARLLGIGATPEEAFGRSGVAQFGMRAPETEKTIADKTYEVGNRVVKINPISGKSEVVYEAPPAPKEETAFAIPIMADPLGLNPPQTVKLTPSQLREALPTLPEFARTNAITKAVLGLNTSTGTNAPATAKSQGGYQVGKVYSGLKYKGGDPNDEGSWEKVR